jgi:hypothetical protein
MSPLFKSTARLGLIFSVSLLTSFKDKAQEQSGPYNEQERVILRKTDFNPPVSIKAVKAKGRRVPVEGRFIDDDDWLRGFTVSVRNESNKQIAHIGIEMLFRPVGNPQQTPAGWFLEYGPNPFHYKSNEAMPLSGVSTVMQTDEIELQLTESQYEDLSRGWVPRKNSRCRN